MGLGQALKPYGLPIRKVRVGALPVFNQTSLFLWSHCTKGFPAGIEHGLVASATAIAHWQKGVVYECSHSITVDRCGAGLGRERRLSAWSCGL